MVYDVDGRLERGAFRGAPVSRIKHRESCAYVQFGLSVFVFRLISGPSVPMSQGSYIVYILLGYGRRDTADTYIHSSYTSAACAILMFLNASCRLAR